VFHAPIIKPFGQVARDATRPNAAEQPQPVHNVGPNPNRELVTAPNQIGNDWLPAYLNISIF
jgi:hypothetical protein